MAFINRNFCKSFQTPLNSSTYTKLASQECTEVIVMMYTTNTNEYVDIIDPNNPTVPFRVNANVESTFRGLTNSDQLSAKSKSNSHTLYYRTQYYGSMTDL